MYIRYGTKLESAKTLIIAPESDEVASKLVNHGRKRPEKWAKIVGVSLGILSLPVAITAAVLTNVGADKLIGWILAGIFSAGMLGLKAWMVVEEFTKWRINRLIKLGRILETHPLLLKMWREEIKRQKIELNPKEFDRELTSRYSFFEEHAEVAEAITHPNTHDIFKAALTQQLEEAMRIEGDKLQITMEPRRVLESYQEEAHNTAIAARFNL